MTLRMGLYLSVIKKDRAVNFLLLEGVKMKFTRYSRNKLLVYLGIKRIGHQIANKNGKNNLKIKIDKIKKVVNFSLVHQYPCPANLK